MFNKKKILFLAVGSLLLTGCENHEHIFNNKYDFNESTHWKVCSKEGCDVIDLASSESHQLGKRNIVTPTTLNNEGTISLRCNVCEYETKLTYRADEENHWQKYSSSDTGSKEGHTFVDYEGDESHVPIKATSTNDGIAFEQCSVCGFIRTKTIEKNKPFEDEWSYDEDLHWHASTNPNNDEKQSAGKHRYGDVKIINNVEIHECTVCGYFEEIDHGKEFYVDELLSPFDIHTNKQKSYLSYEGDYSKMSTNAYPNGTTSLSDPVIETLTWDYANHTNNTKYSVSISQNEDMSGGFEIAGTNDQSLKVYNWYLGKNYYRVNAYNGGLRVSSKVYELDVNDTYIRNLYVGQNMTNCRDMGGRENTKGVKIKQGMLFRTCGSNYNMDNNKIDDEGKTILIDQLKVKTEINLNEDQSYNFGIPLIKTYNTYCDYANASNPSKHNFSRNTESVKNVFEILANEDNYPIAYHCRIGTDRTGLIAILVNGVLGVEINDIYQDYLFSNFGKIGIQRVIGNKNDDDDISKYMDEIQKLPGENFQEQAYNALIAIGVPAETIEKVKEILLDGEIPDNDNGQVFTAVKDMNVELTEIQYEDKTSLEARNYPASYAEMTGGANATFEFEVNASSRELYAYLGHTYSLSDKTIAGSLSVLLDGNPVTVPATTFRDAGMGNCSGRINYYFVKLGDLPNLEEGSHEIVITGVANNMILGGVSIL